MKRIQNKFLELINETYQDAEAVMDANHIQATERKAGYQKMYIPIGWVSGAMGLLMFVICAQNAWTFYSGVDYSGHGIFGKAALLITCTLLAGIAAMIVFWIGGLARRSKRRKVCLPVAFLFMAAFVLGIARHSTVPILTELGCAMASGIAFFLGLFAPERKRDSI